MSTKRAERKAYTREHKLEALRLCGEGTTSVVEVAADLGLTPEQVDRWRVVSPKAS